MKKGFTLVELSIVLVIIGLLIGGILVAQSLIESAKTNAFIRQVGEFDIAVSSFRNKYRHLPGDSPFHGSGDGDGWIENSTIDAGVGNLSTEHSFDEEVTFFWPQLQQDGFLANKYSPFSSDSSSGIDVGIHMPHATNLTKNAGVIIYLNSSFVNPRNEYWFCDFSPTTSEVFTGSSNVNSVLTSTQALSIDAKIDDGLSGRGASPNIYGYDGIMWASNSTDGAANGDGGRCYLSSTSNTYSTNDNLECCVVIRMLSQTE